MSQRIFASIIVGVLFALGLWGQYVIAPQKLTTELTTAVYEILMLFFLSGEWTLELDPVPLQIELVRFLAPLAAVTSIILVLASNSRVSMGNRVFRCCL